MPPVPTSELHLADLHALAAEQGIERYRLLRREDLLASLAERGVEEGESSLRPAAAVETAPPAEPPATRPQRSRRRGGGGRGGAGGGRGGGRGEGRPQRARAERPEADRDEDERDQGADRAEEEPEELTPVSGTVDVLAARHGFLRLEGLEPSSGDVYISASQVRRCELRPGDVVSGEARPARRGERHPAMVHIEAVNGAEPESERFEFAAGTPVAPSRRIPLGRVEGDAGVLLRAVDALVPLGFGQRVLLDAPPRSGGTTLLRAWSEAIGGLEGVTLTVVLIDERPEEVTAWRNAVPEGVTVVAAAADMRPREQARLANLALERAKRVAESGADSVLIFDSLSRLGVAERDPGAVKRVFGAGRELAEDGLGSLTVIATVLGGEDDPAADAIRSTESAVVALDPALAQAGVFPAIDVSGCALSGESELLDEAELGELRRLRGMVADLPPEDAVGVLRERAGG